jgi:hypothetical protein
VTTTDYWQFAEPVWEQEGSGEDITYTPRPPENQEEYVASTILTGGHRIKTTASAIHLGDMTSTGGGLAYVRAVIKNVTITSGEVVPGSGTETITSVWVPVGCSETITLVDVNGDEIAGPVGIYLPDDATDRGRAAFEEASVAQSTWLSLRDEPSDTEINHAVLDFNSMEYPLEETSMDSNTYQWQDDGQTVSAELLGFTGLSPDEPDTLNVEINSTVDEVSDLDVVLSELSNNSLVFSTQTANLRIKFSFPLD